MDSRSPTTEGFRIIFRRMAIPFAEIAWRWTFAAAAWFLGAVYLLEDAGGLPVSRLERVMLGTNQPVLVWRAIRQIFAGSGFRFTRAGILLAVALTIAWVVLCALGRAATVSALMEEFGIEVSAERRHLASLMLPSLVVLNALRSVVTLAALIAGIGSIVLANSVWASTRASVGDVSRLCVALICLIALVWSILNWLLSTACIFAVSEHKGPLDAAAAALQRLQERPSALFVPGIWFGLAHFGAFISFLMAGFTVLGAAGVLSGGTILCLELGLIVFYCALADFLYTGKLAAYVAIIGGGENAEELPMANFFPGGPAHVDHDELILSDRPLPAS